MTNIQTFISLPLAATRPRLRSTCIGSLIGEAVVCTLEGTLWLVDCAVVLVFVWDSQQLQLQLQRLRHLLCPLTKSTRMQATKNRITNLPGIGMLDFFTQGKESSKRVVQFALSEWIFEQFSSFYVIVPWCEAIEYAVHNYLIVFFIQYWWISLSFVLQVFCIASKSVHYQKFMADFQPFV